MRDGLFLDLAEVHLHCTVAACLKNNAREYQLSMSRIAYLPVACYVSRLPVGVNRSDFLQWNIRLP